MPLTKDIAATLREHLGAQRQLITPSEIARLTGHQPALIRRRIACAKSAVPVVRMGRMLYLTIDDAAALLLDAGLDQRIAT